MNVIRKILDKLLVPAWLVMIDQKYNNTVMAISSESEG